MTGVVVWFTGLPSSGKSMLAGAVYRRLAQLDVPTCILDGDAVRAALRPTPGYGDRERDDFYATLAGLAALLARQRLAVLVPATAHRRSFRERARLLAPAFVEVYVDTPLEECERRDTKGVFAAARAGTLSAAPGLQTPYEPPLRPDVLADREDLARTVDMIVAKLGRIRAESQGASSRNVPASTEGSVE